jgi:hypothetical protein
MNVVLVADSVVHRSAVRADGKHPDHMDLVAGIAPVRRGRAADIVHAHPGAVAGEEDIVPVVADNNHPAAGAYVDVYILPNHRNSLAVVAVAGIVADPWAGIHPGHRAVVAAEVVAAVAAVANDSYHSADNSAVPRPRYRRHLLAGCGDCADPAVQLVVNPYDIISNSRFLSLTH